MVGIGLIRAEVAEADHGCKMTSQRGMLVANFLQHCPDVPADQHTGAFWTTRCYASASASVDGCIASAARSLRAASVSGERNGAGRGAIPRPSAIAMPSRQTKTHLLGTATRCASSLRCVHAAVAVIGVHELRLIGAPFHEDIRRVLTLADVRHLKAGIERRTIRYPSATRLRIADGFECLMQQCRIGRVDERAVGIRRREHAFGDAFIGDHSVENIDSG